MSLPKDVAECDSCGIRNFKTVMNHCPMCDTYTCNNPKCMMKHEMIENNDKK